MICESCGEHSFLIPLHGGKGGPLRCPLCVGKWNAEHGRRRRTGRIVIRAMKAFSDAGGKYDDIDKLKTSATMGGMDFGLDPLGYMDGIARLDGDDADLTSELLSDVLRLTHPDHHPLERQDLARRVTQQLLALQPFVFPAPKPKKPVGPTPKAEAVVKTKQIIDKIKPQAQQYPCSDCADASRWDYCDACKAEYQRREQEKFERRTAKQRAQYQRRRQERLARRPQAICAACGAQFKSSRGDARYCSERCRQQAHRKPVTDNKKTPRSTLINRDKLARDILALLDRHRAVYLNDLLPGNRTSAQYQAVSLIAAKLEAEGKIETLSYWTSWGNPGRKVLVKPGHEVKGRQVTLLKDNERLRLDPR